MKNKLLKAFCLILTSSLLISCFSVFGFAAEQSDEEGNKQNVELMVNRSFDEGWEINNGITVTPKKQKIFLDYEESVDFDYNYFTRFSVLSESSTDYDGMIQLKFDNPRQYGSVALEFDIMSDTVCNVGRIGYYLTDPSASKRDLVSFCSIVDNNLRVTGGGQGIDIAYLNGQWVHVAMILTMNQELRMCGSCQEVFNKNEQDNCKNQCSATNNCVIQVRFYFGETEIYDAKNALNASEAATIDTSANTYYWDCYQRLTRDYMPAAVSTYRIGFTQYREDTKGMSFCVDNLLFYSDPAPCDEEGNFAPMEPIEDIDNVDIYGYGSYVNKYKNKTVQLLTGEGGVDYISEGLVMKIGSSYLLNKNQRQPIFTNAETGKAYGSPIKVNGIVYVPLEVILNVTGYPIFDYLDGKTYEISTENGSSTLTIGKSTAVVNGEKVALKSAPMMASDPDDKTNTYPVIAMDDVEKFFQGYYVTYDEMGLIIISQGKNVINRERELGEMLKLMKSFIYDYSDSDELLDMMRENTNDFNHPYLLFDDDSISYMRDVYSGVISDSTYKGWLDSYISKADEYMEYFTTLPENPANPTYTEKAYITNPDKYKLLAFEITNPFSGIKDGEVWTDNDKFSYVKPADENGYYYPSKLHDKNNGEHYNDGYDYSGGRNDQLAIYAEYVLELAIAYLISGDEKYAQLAYDMQISLSDDENWHNWAHKTYLNTADSVLSMSLAYDWLYDVWCEIQNERAEKYDLAYITQTMYEKAFYHGYETSRYKKASEIWTRDCVDGYVNGATNNAWNWSTVNINWNCVCNCSLVIAAMAIAGESDEKINYCYPEDGVNTVEWILSNNLWRIADYGLEQYAPDGSYIESPSYWHYATDFLSLMLAVLPNAFGDDLGFYETWGLDKTYYYAVQIEYPVLNASGGKSYNVWAYNDHSGSGGMTTKSFFIAAEFLNDPSLAAIRIDGIKNGKGVTWVDIATYKPEYSTLTMADVNMSLDWKLESLEGIVARSTWENSPTYCGVMGNHNNATQHDQVDSGNFIYASQGYSWIVDLGADEYDVYQYWGDDIRERYYRNSPEGHNTVVVTSLQDPSLDDYMPYGQSILGGGKLDSYYDGGAAGMYAVINNADAYGNITNYARRGMLFTNNRETVVIQDEIAFRGVQSCAWVAHTMGNIYITGGGKTAYITQNVAGKSKSIRLTLLSDNSKLKFEKMSCGIKDDDFLMEGANRPGYSESHGQLPEKDRSDYSRLVIKCANSLFFNCAVVIENVENASDSSPVRYDYVQISKWSVSENYDAPEVDTEQSDNNTVTSAKMTDIQTYTAQATKLLLNNYAFTTRSVDFFKNLVKVTVAVNTYRPESFKNIPTINSAYKKYLGYLESYKAYSTDINTAVSSARNITYGMSLYS